MKNLRNKKSLTALTGLLGLAVIMGSWAYFSQTSTVVNPFDTGDYGSTIIENFKPSDGENWMPGVEVDKEVFAINTGDVDLIVRARLDETWMRKGNTTPYKDSANDPYDVYTVYQDNSEDGLVDDDKSAVTKNFSTSANWIKGDDGWYYYAVNLKKGETTDMWLSSVQLLEDADMGLLETRKYVSVSVSDNADDWVWVEYIGSMPKYLDASGQPVGASATGAQEVLHNKVETAYANDNGIDLLGYSQSEYNLKVTIQTVQTTQDALDAVFGGGSSFTVPTGTSWVLK